MVRQVFLPSLIESISRGSFNLGAIRNGDLVFVDHPPAAPASSCDSDAVIAAMVVGTEPPESKIGKHATPIRHRM